MEKIQVRPKIFLAVSVAVAIVCVLLMPKVNVNSDMTKYLPDNSRMKQGIDILTSEFGQDASAAVADVRIMMESPDWTEEKVQALEDSLSLFKGVDAVKVTRGEDHTLYELNVSKSVHQKRLAAKIKKAFPYNIVTQTSQDGNTPAPKALIMAVICLVVILLIMSESFLEPLLFLIATGMAVGVNMGTNAFLPSVSITTHSIAAVLQLALSMDYSIILMGRFRQTLAAVPDKYEAMAKACKKAAPAILSSSLTTVVGLLMLVFMNLKIGKDLGIVLAKGVVCSLVYTYAALPGLILIFHDGIKATEKRVPIRGTGIMSRFTQKFRIPLTVIFVLLFAVSYQLSTRTRISFSTSTPSAIDAVFPKKNTVVLLYENAKEDSVVALLDKVALDPGVDAVYSYPTLMKKKLSAEEMTAFLREKAEEQGSGQEAEMLTPDLMRICYYAKFGNPDLKISFTDLVDFVTKQKENPLLKGVDIPDLDEKLEMLKMIRDVAYVEPAAMPAAAPGRNWPVTAAPPFAVPQSLTVHEYMALLHAQQGSADTKMLLNLSDPAKLATKMTVEQMTSFMGSTPTQTKMVYSFSNNKKEGMTPLEFAHFLTDDLFNRKALAPMISKDQKAGMLIRTRIMDSAASGKTFSVAELDAMVLEYGLKEGLKEEVREETKAEAPQEEVKEEAKEEFHEMQVQKEDVPQQEVEAVEVVDPRLELLEKMLRPGQKYDAARMARNFRALGENVDEFSLSMLYKLYGSEKDYNPEWKMDMEELVAFASDMISDERLAPYIGADIKEQFDTMKSGLTEGVSALKGPEHSIAAILTDYPDEDPQTESFVRSLEGSHYLIGESVMLCEMKDGFKAELRLVTLLTILAIFAIVAFTFRSIITAVILVMAVMTAVFANVAASGIGGSSDLYLAYLIVQSILMGATIDYGILFTTYYREHRDLIEAYRGSIHTILTSGLIMCCVPGAMALLLDDAMIQPIVQNLAVGSFSAVLIVMLILPGVLSLVFPKKK